MTRRLASKKDFKKVLEHRIFAGIIIALVNFAVFSYIIHNGIYNSWNFRLTDTLYTKTNETASEIVIVAIDDHSLQDKEKGGLGRWQEWGRDYHAKVLQNLLDANAAVIGVDIIFTEESKDKAADAQLADVVRGTDRIVLASYFNLDATDDKRVITYGRPLVMFYGGDETKLGPINVRADLDDNILRKIYLFFQFENKIYESFDIVMLKKYLGESVDTLESVPIEDENYVVTKNKFRPPTNVNKLVDPIKVPLVEGNKMYINYFGPPYSFQQLSYVDVYNGNFKPEQIQNKIVLIGEMGATGLHDVQYTPVSHGQEMPGVEIHANTIQTLLTQKFLRTQDRDKQLWSIGLINVFSTMLFLMVSVLFSTIILILGTIFFFLVSLEAFKHGILVNMFYIPLSYLLVYIMVIIFKYMVEARGRKYLKTAFSHYVSEHLVEKIIKDPDLLQLGGSKRELTIMFSDLQGFTSLSEQLSPEQLVKMLNEYLTDMTNTVFQHRGTLDKYIGDAVMAFWGAPVDDPDHAYHACMTALDMQHKMKTIHERFKKELGIDLYVRIGLNTGEAVVGNFGSNVRFDYTVIGDTVNLASRLEGANKQYHIFMMASESTYQKTKDRFEYRELDSIKVKGKSKPVTIFELLEKKGHLDVTKQNAVNLFHQGLQHYRARKWDKALAVFQEVLEVDPADGPSQVYIERCGYLKKEAPPEDWDGSFTMKTK